MTAHLSWDRLEQLAEGAGATDAPAAAARLHLAECGRCREALASLRALGEAARALPASIDPPETLWPALSVTLAARRRKPPAVRPLPRRLAVETRWLAAAALVLMALTAAGTAWLLRPPSAPRVATGGAGALVAIPASFAATERAYLDDVAQLQSLLAVQRPRLAAATVAVVERSLDTIDAAIAEARTALIADPANRELAELLAAGYRQKVELLRRAAEVPGST